MPFTRSDAAALHERIRLGWSVFDEQGNEQLVPVKQRREYNGAIPSVDELLARFKDAEQQLADPAQLAAHVRRVAGAAAVEAVERLAPLPLEAWAAKGGVTVDEALATPDPPREVVHSREQNALYRSRVPKRFREMLEARSARMLPPVADVEMWLDGGKWAIGLGGVRGSGKTTAACWGLVEVGGGLFVTAEEIAAPTSEARELAEAAEEAPYLILDEMGDEALTEVGAVRIRHLLGSRHKAKRRTAMTANLTLAQWADRYGARLVDWMREGYGYREYGGASLRGAA